MITNYNDDIVLIIDRLINKKLIIECSLVILKKIDRLANKK